MGFGRHPARRKRSGIRFFQRPAARVRPLPTAPIEVQIMGAGTLDVLRVRDISATGLGVYVPHRFDGCDIDAEVELVITLPQLRPFLARGVIRHVTATGEPAEYFGVQFTELKDEHRQRIRHYVRTHSDPR